MKRSNLVITVIAIFSLNGCMSAMEHGFQVQGDKNYSNSHFELSPPQQGMGRLFLYMKDTYGSHAYAIDNKMYIIEGTSYFFIDLPEGCTHRVVDIYPNRSRGYIPGVNNIDLDISNNKPVFVKLVDVPFKSFGGVYPPAKPELVNSASAEAEMADLFLTTGSMYNGREKKPRSQDQNDWPARNCTH